MLELVVQKTRPVAVCDVSITGSDHVMCARAELPLSVAYRLNEMELRVGYGDKRRDGEGAARNAV